MYSIINYALRTAIIVVIAICLTATNLMAFPITVSFSGHIQQVASPVPITEISLGDLFVGQFQYETTTPGLMIDPTRVVYWYPFSYFNITVNNLTYYLNSSGYAYIIVVNDFFDSPGYPYQPDGIETRADLIGPSVGGYPVSTFDLILYGTSLFSSTSLPSGPINLNVLSFNIASLDFFDASSNTLWPTFSGGVETFDVSAVPEPSTLLLLGFGLAGLTGFGKKFKK